MNYSITLLFPLVIIFGWIMVFMVTDRYHQLHDRLLLLMLGCCSIALYSIARHLIEGAYDYQFVIVDNIESFSGLSICPLLFLYIRTVAHDTKWQRWYWWLFAPSFIIFVIGTLLSIIVGWDRVIELRQYCDGHYLHPSESLMEMIYMFVNIELFNIVLEVMDVVLVGLSVYYLIKYYRHAGDFFANIEDSSARRIHNILVSSILSLLTIYAVTFFIYDIYTFSRLLHEIFGVWISALSWIIGYNTYKIKLTEKHLELLELRSASSESSVGSRESRAERGIARGVNSSDIIVEHKMKVWQEREDMPFCREGLTIADVARDMDISHRVLSDYINRVKGVNFNRWINSLRIEYAKTLLSTTDSKIGYISTVCGYSDQAAFSKAFSREVSCSPQRYREAPPSTAPQAPQMGGCNE